MLGLEDFHEDILGKAMRGLGIGKNEMAQRLGVDKAEIEAILLCRRPPSETNTPRCTN